MDPKVISLDIESYGACEANTDGKLLPQQTVFNPLRSMHTDGVDREDLALTVAITLPEYDPRCTTNHTSVTNSNSKQDLQQETTTSTSLTALKSSKTSSVTSRVEPMSWNCSSISELLPGTTMVFQTSVESHRSMLRGWLLHSDTIIGMNLQFDIQYLRQIPDYRFVLDGRHTLLDLSVINYIHTELRPEKSLKSLGPVLGTHTYKETLKDGRFRNPTDPGIISYNAQDTHNTMMCVSEISKRILKECECNPLIKPETSSSPFDSMEKNTTSTTKISSQYSLEFSNTHPTGVNPSKETTQSSTSCLPPRSAAEDSHLVSLPSWGYESKQILRRETESKTSKLSPHCIKHYSDTIWSCIRMSETGIPMNMDALSRLQNNLELKCKLSANQALSKFNLVLEGTGSAKSKQDFLDLVIDEIDNHSDIEILNHPLLSLTPKTKKISWSEDNRNLLSNHLPQTHPLQQAIKLIKYHASSQKLISSYVFPLLHHRRNKPKDKSSVLIPLNKNIGLAHPTWYIVPSLPKDTGSEGGTIQGRITCKSPSAQTFPPLIKKTMQSRWSDGVILGFDLSQIELRVAALLSGDEKLLQSYNDNLDLHTDRTISVFGEDIQQEPDFKSKFRQIGKTLNFADLFLASASRMQRTVVEMCGDLMPIPFFENIVRTRYDQRPGLCEWQYELCKVVEDHGMVVLPFTGQSRTFAGFQINHSKWAQDRIVSPIYSKNFKSPLNEIVNFPIQTTAGNTLLQIQHKLSRLLPSLNSTGARPLMFLQVYDAVYFDCPANQVDDLNELIGVAVDDVASDRGYWGNLQQLFHREVPLLYETEIVR